MANIFTDDENLIAGYNFEPDTLLEDFVGSNDLTATGYSVTSHGDHYQGLGSVLLTADSRSGARNDFSAISRSNADLSIDFPGKSGQVTTECAFAYWIKLAWNNYDTRNLSSKSTNTLRHPMRFLAIYDSYVGASHDGTYRVAEDWSNYTLEIMQPNAWYHFTAIFENNEANTAHTITLLIWEPSSQTYVVNSVTQKTSPIGSGLSFGYTTFLNQYLYPQTHYAWMNELLVFNRAITTIEAGQIALGTYTPPGYVAPSDALSTFPATRPAGYNPDLSWQPGTWVWGPDYVATGGGRWHQQLVCTGNGKVYYEALS